MKELEGELIAVCHLKAGSLLLMKLF